MSLKIVYLTNFPLKSRKILKNNKLIFKFIYLKSFELHLIPDFFPLSYFPHNLKRFLSTTLYKGFALLTTSLLFFFEI